MFLLLRADNCILRRCWGYFEDQGYDPFGATVFSVYHGDNNRVENCIATMDQSQRSSFHYTGFSVHSSDTPSADNNLFKGNIAYKLGYWGFKCSAANPRKYNSPGNVFKQNVAIDCSYGYMVRGGVDLVVENLTAVECSSSGLYGQEIDPDNGTININATVKNCNFIGVNSGGKGIYLQKNPEITLTNDYNNVYNFATDYAGDASAGANEFVTNPNFDKATYGKGAYLKMPAAMQGKGESNADVGAEVLYRYEDGALTSTPLWPWPMEDRIFAETGISVTWEANGGLWKTLDGVYSAGDNIRAPKGLRIQ